MTDRQYVTVLVRAKIRIKVGAGTGPFCDDCGCDLSLSEQQMDYLRQYGSPIPRPPCPGRLDGLHRVAVVGRPLEGE